MIGVRITPHHTHQIAVLVRVAAALVVIGSISVILVALAGIALHHLPVATALFRSLGAAALMLLTVFAARRFDPLRD